MKMLTDKQRNTMCVIVRYIDEHGFPPTLAELSMELGTGISSIAGRLYALQRLGYLRVSHGVPRGIKVLKRGETVIFEAYLPQDHQAPAQ